MAARTVKMNSVSLLSAKLLDGWTMLADGCPDCQVRRALLRCHLAPPCLIAPANIFDVDGDPLQAATLACCACRCRCCERAQRTLLRCASIAMHNLQAAFVS